MWKAIDGFPRYAVSTDGQVKGPKGIMRPRDNGKGYKKVIIRNESEKTEKYIHILVAEAFIPKREGCEVNHIDRDRGNCRADNLEWLTHKENMLYSRRRGAWANTKTNG